MPIAVERRSDIAAGELLIAWLPYLLLVVFVLIWGRPDDEDGHQQVDRRDAAGVPADSSTVLNGLTVPGLHNADHADPPGDARAGAVCGGVRVELAERRRHRLLPRRDCGRDPVAGVADAASPARTSATFKQLAMPMVTIACMLGLAYVMNYSGMTSTLGLALAATGPGSRSSARCLDGSACSSRAATRPPTRCSATCRSSRRTPSD